ncbi:MAG: N-formylglutamate amidohydrolase [Desulfobacterales bacterium]|nr:N-formylglutamate amidohydrolase [Desulfobacterales bacterium]
MTLPFVISIPHCSARVPEEIQATLALNDQQIIESVDFGTQEIFGSLPAQATVMAQWSRLMVDLNRGPLETGPKGVAALADYHGRSIYKQGAAPDQEILAERVTRFHHPYHDQVAHALGNANAIGLIDSHSLNGTGPADAPDPGKRRKDVVLSNNGDSSGAPRKGFGSTSCSPKRLHRFKAAFQRQGLSVSMNAPYQGGYTVKHYGQQLVKEGRFAVQIELNQDLYMHPGNLTPQAHRTETVAQQVLAALEEVAAVILTGDGS